MKSSGVSHLQRAPELTNHATEKRPAPPLLYPLPHNRSNLPLLHVFKFSASLSRSARTNRLRPRASFSFRTHLQPHLVMFLHGRAANRHLFLKSPASRPSASSHGGHPQALFAHFVKHIWYRLSLPAKRAAARRPRASGAPRATICSQAAPRLMQRRKIVSGRNPRRSKSATAKRIAHSGHRHSSAPARRSQVLPEHASSATLEEPVPGRLPKIVSNSFSLLASRCAISKRFSACTSWTISSVSPPYPPPSSASPRAMGSHNPRAAPRQDAKKTTPCRCWKTSPNFPPDQAGLAHPAHHTTRPKKKNSISTARTKRSSSRASTGNRLRLDFQHPPCGLGCSSRSPTSHELRHLLHPSQQGSGVAPAATDSLRPIAARARIVMRLQKNSVRA